MGMLVLAQEQARQVYVEIEMKLLTESIRQGAVVSGTKCVKGIPRSARFLWGHKTRVKSIVLIFEHESFAEVHIGSPIPIFELEFEDT